MFVSSRDYRVREPDVVINGNGGSLLPQSAAEMRFSSSVVNQYRATPHDKIIGHAFHRPSVSDDISHQIVAHKIQKVVPPFSLPSTSTTKSDNMVLYHAVDSGDLAFALRRRLEVDVRAVRNNFYAKQDRAERAPHGSIINLATVNYILRGLQTVMGDNTVNWESFLRDTGWPVDTPTFKLADFQQGRTQHRNLSMFVQDYIRPLGVVIGSDKQGGQHQGGLDAVDAPVDFVVTILVDGMCDSMLNLWRRTDIRAGDDLLLVLCGYAMSPHEIKTTGAHPQIITVNRGPMENQFSVNGEGLGVDAKKFSPPELHTPYVLNHWAKAVVHTMFTSAPNILYELVPTTSSEIDEGYFLGDDRRNRGLWHIARSQMQTRGASSYSTLRPQTFRNDNANLEAGVLLVQSTVAPVWKSAVAAHRKDTSKQTTVHTTNHTTNHALSSIAYHQTSVMAVGASLGSVLQSTPMQQLISILSVGVGTSVAGEASGLPTMTEAIADVPGSIELVRMFKLQSLMLLSVRSWEKFVSQIRQYSRTSSILKSALATMQEYGEHTIQFYNKGPTFEYVDIVCAQEYDDFLVWLKTRQMTRESTPVTVGVGTELEYTSWIFNFYSYCSAWIYTHGKGHGGYGTDHGMVNTLCKYVFGDLSPSSSFHDIATSVCLMGVMIMHGTYDSGTMPFPAMEGDVPKDVEKGQPVQEIVVDTSKTGKFGTIYDRKKNSDIITDLLGCQLISPLKGIWAQLTSFMQSDKNVNSAEAMTRLKAYKLKVLHIKNKLGECLNLCQVPNVSDTWPSVTWDTYKWVLNLYKLTPPPDSPDDAKFQLATSSPACCTALMSIVSEDISALSTIARYIVTEEDRMTGLYTVKPAASLTANPPADPIARLPLNNAKLPIYLARGGVEDSTLSYTPSAMQKLYDTTREKVLRLDGGELPILDFLIKENKETTTEEENKATTTEDMMQRIPNWNYNEHTLFAALKGLESKESCIVKELIHKDYPVDNMDAYTYTVGPKAEYWAADMKHHPDKAQAEKQEQSSKEMAETLYIQCITVEEKIVTDLSTYRILSLEISAKGILGPMWPIVAECIDLSDGVYNDGISNDHRDKLALKWEEAIASGEKVLANAEKVAAYFKEHMRAYKSFLETEAKTEASGLGVHTLATGTHLMNHIGGRPPMKRAAESAPDTYDSAGQTSPPPAGKRAAK
jgi:hypothetical protein